MTVTNTLSFVFVSHRTSSCCTLKDKVPATLSPAEVQQAQQRKRRGGGSINGANLTTTRYDAVETLRHTGR